MDESIIKLKYKKCKYKVKKWESEFKEKYSVNPSKADIKQAPSKIKEAYRIYYLLKTQALENTLLDVTLDEDTQDCFSLINSSNINFSFASLDDAITQVGDNSTYNNITLDESIYNKGDETCDTSTIINKNEKEINSENNFINESLEVNICEGKKDDKTVNDCNVIEAISDKVDKTVNDCDLTEIISDKTEVINENIDKSLNDSFINSDKVWGKHLDSKVSNKNSKDIKSKPSKPLSYSFSEKLFQNFNVKLRNPRRDILFKRKNKTHENKDNINDVDATNIESNDTNDNSSINKQSYISTDKNTGNINKNNDSVSAFNIFNEKVKVIIKSTPNINKSANASCNTATSNTIVLKSFDKGWLERTNTYNKLSSSKNSLDLIDSGFESAESSYVNNSTMKSNISDDNNSNENKLNDKLHQCDKNIVSESDDDIVYNSDSETATKSQSLFNIPKIKRSFEQIEENNETSYNVLLKKPKLFEESINLPFQNDSKIGTNLSMMNVVNSETVITKDQKCKINLKQKPMNDIERKEELLRKKVASGKANNNFVRINIQKKVYVRGRKTMKYSKYKKNLWKKKKDQLQQSDDFSDAKGVFKCYKCNDVGHYARNCRKGLDRLIPKEDIDEDDSPFPTLEEAEEMAKEAAERVCRRKQGYHKNVPAETGEEENKLENETKAVSLQELDSDVKVATLSPLFKLNEDNNIIDTPLIVNQALLEFGHNQFQPGQETAIMRILSGLSTLVTLSTGSGKSLCYQLPAYLFQKLSEISCITLVVSPLVSLMEDQVTCMSNAPIKMGCLHMNQTPKQRLAVLEQLKEGLLTVLIVSPETVVSGESVPGSLSNELQKLPPITFACIDEVHCVSQWSHNFRPSYLVLCKVLKERFGVKTFLGLTATATKSTMKDIVEQLSVPDGLDGVISNVQLPVNLILSVSKDYDRDQALVKLLQSNRFKFPASVIIYCTRREDCERIAMYIRTYLQDEALLYTGKKKGRLSTIAEPYHAGLTAPKRKQVQNAFMSGQLRIVVATIAFGMGINKPDVRGVIHYNMPSSFESYVQEIGRAGRDSLEANCHVFLDSKGGDLNELRRHIYANSMDRHTLRKLLQQIFVPCLCKSDCSTHEVAFSISDTVQSLDVKEEAISTLLSYLELHNKKWIINLPHTYTMCKIQSYKGAKHLRSLARKCPPLAVAVARELKKGTKPEKLNILNFPVIELASSMNWDSGSVKYHLKQLEWTPNVNGVRCRSGLLIEFSELGFRVKAAGNMSNEELDFALDSLHERVKNQQNTALSQLHIIFQTLTNVACETIDYLDKADLSNSDKLKSIIRDYFENPVEQSPSILHHQEKLENEAQIISDIRSLVFSFKDSSFTGRSIARVFHGIASPNFPAIVMSRSPFWRAHLDQDFILLCNLASRELLRMR